MDFPDYDLAKPDKMGFVLHPKSFEQGFTTLALENVSENPIALKPFKILFIYYDPIVKQG